MNCDEVRLALGAEPGLRSAEIAAHLAECSGCTAFAAELAAFDARIRQALEVPVPAGTRATAPGAPPGAAPAAPVLGAVGRPSGGRPRRWFALAAGGLVAAVIAAALWTAYPRVTLAGALVDHMAHEPDAWTGRTPVAAGTLAYVLGRSHVQLEAGTPLVSYASSCWFRGWFVPHLVVQTGHGPVTVIVLTHERVGTRVAVDSGGYRGVIVPASRGALAVLARDADDTGADVDAVVARVSAAVRYLD